jgi:hypothetical protein
MGPVTAIEKVARRTDVKVFAKSPLPVFPRASLRVLQALDRPEFAAGQTDRITATVFRPLFSLPPCGGCWIMDARRCTPRTS